MKVDGFSIIELLIVVIIVAISLSLAVSTMGSSLLNSKIRHTSEGLVDAINFSKSEAIKRSEIIQLTIATNGNYRISVVGDNTLETIRTVTGAAGVQLNSAVSNGGSIELLVAPNGKFNRTTTIRILPENGSCADHLCMNVELNEHGKVKICNPSSRAEILRCG